MGTLSRVRIEEGIISPTNDQAQACLRVCQALSTCYRNIELLRFDDQTGNVFIFVNEELQIVAPRNGFWRFL
jgi:hypothetical protein